MSLQPTSSIAVTLNLQFWHVGRAFCILAHCEARFRIDIIERRHICHRLGLNEAANSFS